MCERCTGASISFEVRGGWKPGLTVIRRLFSGFVLPVYHFKMQSLDFLGGDGPFKSMSLVNSVRKWYHWTAHFYWCTYTIVQVPVSIYYSALDMLLIYKIDSVGTIVIPYEFASSVPKGCKSGFVTYRHHVVQQAELQLVVKYYFWLVMFYPIKICS